MAKKTSSEKRMAMVAQFIKNKKALVVDKTSVSRISLKKLLIKLEMPGENIYLSDNYREAECIIRDENPHFIITEYDLGDYCGIDLLQVQREFNKNRLDCSFVLIADKNTAQIKARTLEEDIGALVVKPYTLDILQKTFLRSLSGKINPSQYTRILEEGKAFYHFRKFEKAREEFLKAKNENEEDPWVFYYLGSIDQEFQDYDEAKDFLNKALQLNPHHYRTLISLIEIYMEEKNFKEAYGHLKTLKEKVFVNPVYLPDYIKLSIINGKYEDIFYYLDIFEEMEDENTRGMRKSIAAGMVICGRNLLKTPHGPKAIELLKKGIEYGRGNPEVCRQAISALMEGNRVKEAEECLKKVSEMEEIPDKEYRLMELEIRSHTVPIGECLKLAMNMRSRGTTDPLVFEIIIKGFISVGRRKDAIEDVVFEAGRKFPAKKEFFDKFLNQIK